MESHGGFFQYEAEVIRRLCFVALALLISTGVYAQVEDSTRINDTYIINTRNYKRGVYKTFEEFKYNNPSITDFSIVDKRPAVTNPKTGRAWILRKRDTWGYCDGSKIYVRRNKYNEMIGQGRYCYFREKGVKMAIGVVFPYILPIPVPYSETFIINFNNGKSFLLSKRLLKQILDTDDKDLLKQFMADPEKKKKLIGYVNLYNQRNTHRIK